MKKGLIILFSAIVAFNNYFYRVWVAAIPFHVIRLLFYKMLLSKLGKHSTILMGVEFRSGRNITIGRNTVINAKVLLDGRGGKLKIGHNVDIAQETNIWTLEHDLNDDYHRTSGGNVNIEDFVWICSRCTILPGITIGRGAVVASNSVVTKDVAPMSIVAGIPARCIGFRTSKLKYTLKFRPWFQ